MVTGQHAKNSFYIAGGTKDDKVFGKKVHPDDIIDPNYAAPEDIEGQFKDIGLDKPYDYQAEAEEDLDAMKDGDAASDDEVTCYMDSESAFMHMLKEKTKEHGVDADAATVASSVIDAMSVYSGVPTTYYSKKYDQYNDQLEAEKQKRAAIEHQIDRIKNEMLENAKLIKM